MNRIYCVEDDANIRGLILYTLKTMGFLAYGCVDGDALWKMMGDDVRGLPDLILMDIMLPGEDGTALLRRLRKSELYREIPVIMLTAKGSEADKVQALDCGADDYITKPFGMMELVSRIRAVLRRYRKNQGYTRNILEHNGIQMDDTRHEVTCGGREISLTLKEYMLLRTFLQYPDMVFTRTQLLDDLWGHEFIGESRTLDVHIATLRQKLGPLGKNIETVRGVGYRMRGERSDAL